MLKDGSEFYPAGLAKRQSLAEDGRGTGNACFRKESVPDSDKKAGAMISGLGYHTMGGLIYFLSR